MLGCRCEEMLDAGVPLRGDVGCWGAVVRNCWRWGYRCEELSGTQGQPCSGANARPTFPAAHLHSDTVFVVRTCVRDILHCPV